MAKKRVFTLADVVFQPKSNWQELYCKCCRIRLATREAKCVPAYIICCELEHCGNYAQQEALEIAIRDAHLRESQEIKNVGRAFLPLLFLSTLFGWHKLEELIVRGSIKKAATPKS